MKAISLEQEFLRSRCQRAAQIGAGFDLTGCCYEEQHDGCGAPIDPASYYYLLAGLVSTFRAKKILEIGTHYGGSIKAMIRGVAPEELDSATFVTVDLTYENELGFANYPDTLIRRFHGDAENPMLITEVCEAFDGGPIDLLYIDADHSFEGTAVHIASFGERLRPRLVVIDDIRLNPSMKALWHQLVEFTGERAFDASEIADRSDCGFGVLWRR